MSTGPSIIALNVGNTRVQIACFNAGDIDFCVHAPNDDLPVVMDHVRRGWDIIQENNGAAIVMGSVHEHALNALRSAIEDQFGEDVYIVGADLPIPIGQQLDPETMTGVDRLLNAAAAFDELKQACIVVDAGTALTVDFVDGEGVFHGGAIAPGAAMQLQALHDSTDALPEIAFNTPDEIGFGRSTAQAMLHGVFHGMRGTVARLVENYAEVYGAFPLVLATGGDAATIFEGDVSVDRIVPDLTVRGMAVAARHALAPDGASADGDD